MVIDGRGISAVRCWLSVFVRFGHAFVLDVSAVSVVISDVSDDLSAAIRQQNSIRSSDVTLFIALLLMSVVVVGIIVFDGIGKRVWITLMSL